MEDYILFVVLFFGEWAPFLHLLFSYLDLLLLNCCRVTLETPEAQAAAAREFVQFCILPRVLNSPTDALYCARFLQKSHRLGPPGFRLLAVVDRVSIYFPIILLFNDIYFRRSQYTKFINLKLIADI